MSRKIELQVEDLSIFFGGLVAVDGVSFHIKKGQIVGLIGPNGAGKTTIFNLLTGVYAPTRGDIYLEEKSLLKYKTYQRCQMGLSRTFQNIRLFKDLSVIDNVKTAMTQQMHYSMLSGVFRGPGYRKEEREISRRAHELLGLMGLDEFAHDYARNLPYGQQRKLEIARALASGPKVLLLDEPAAGMNPTETAELMETVKMLRDRFDISVLLIEHDMNFVMDICEYIFVLDYGRIIARGEPAEIQGDERVIEAYLGGDALDDEAEDA
ncbi:ABC transporter ATP-binding protein [Ruminococcaceae bacterium OttesenSCG-928-D13]|nr:ABC transporter ATP-binding protein [Ruminococcaceae bacterium OttesenSCG-928-D13]